MTLIRADLERKRDELRQQRGAAVLDQEAFNSDAIAAVEAEISALDDAEREETRRQRTAAEGAYQAELSENRSMLGALVAEDLRDV